MLRGISPLISPSLLHDLSAMGHGDTILLADAHYPIHGSSERTIRADGIEIPSLLQAVLEVMPLDWYQSWQFALMEPVGDDPTPSIWNEYQTLLKDAAQPLTLERSEFYKKGSKSFVTVITGETRQYGNILLSKGVVGIDK